MLRANEQIHMCCIFYADAVGACAPSFLLSVRSPRPYVIKLHIVLRDLFFSR